MLRKSKTSSHQAGAAATPFDAATLRKSCVGATEELSTVSSLIAERLQLLDEKDAAWGALELRMQENAKSASDKIKLDVGGRIFATAKANLLRFEGSYFHAMLASGHWKPDSDGAYFIDLNPKHFDRVLDYLRTGELSLAGLRPDQVQQLRKTLDYLQLSPVIIERLQWDPEQRGNLISLADDNRVATSGTTTWQAVQSTTPCTRFNVRLVTGTNTVMVGFAPRVGFTPTASTYDSLGWYFFLYNGKLFAQGGVSHREYRGASVVASGGKVTAVLDRQSNSICFEMNGRLLGTAFTAIPAGDMYATVCLYSSSVALEDD